MTPVCHSFRYPRSVTEERKKSPEMDPEGHTLAAPVGAVPSARLTSADEGPPLVAGRYEILGMLGSGGMGTVYRARDRELDEIVALKLLRKELASSAGMIERFRREVKLARRVTHRNVARTFDIGEHEGDRFLTMELIEGEMLGTHLARRGRVPLRDLIPIAVDLCAGLAAAHAAGVLHRDLKPENVILARDGRAVITDFGIARVANANELGRTIGGIVGTPAYMAPEQVEGVADLDGRADLYALGAMLFELLSGKMAWPGDSVVAVATARILRPPPDVRTHLPELPEIAAAIVLKLMARQREDRFASAEEAGDAIAALRAADLPSSRSLAPPPPPTITMPTPPGEVRRQRKTVAVLPLVNLAAEDDEYLVQTITEDLVDLLSVVPELRVRPRGETVRFSSRSRDVREAGRELGVDVVVDGSLRRVRDLVRVSLRLVTVEDGFQLWARRFDVSPAAVLNVADDAASAVAHALATERTAEPRPVARDPEALELFLRGRYLLNRGWFEASRQGVDMLREAHRRLPDDARIAGTYALSVARILTSERDREGIAAAHLARELAERTLEKDPAQAEARVALGFLHVNDGEGAAAATQMRRALSVAPNAVEALDGIGRMLVEAGRIDLGMATLRRALAIDPLMSHPKQSMARTYALLGERARAREELLPMPEEPGDFVAHTLLLGRFALWFGERGAADELAHGLTMAKDLTPYARDRLEGLLHFAKVTAMTPELCAMVDAALPVVHAFAPRRLAFHAQLRTEIKLSGGATEAGLNDLHAADSNGLLDLFWLDRCPLFDGLRENASFRRVRQNTAARAERVCEILDPSA